MIFSFEYKVLPSLSLGKNDKFAESFGANTDIEKNLLFSIIRKIQFLIIAEQENKKQII